MAVNDSLATLQSQLPGTEKLLGMIEGARVKNVIDDHYGDKISGWVRYMKAHPDAGIVDGLRAYVEELKVEKGGKRLSAHTINSYLSGCVSRTKWVMDSLLGSEHASFKASIKEELSNIKRMKIQSVNAVDKAISPKSLEKLLAETEDMVVWHFVAFMSKTGCRIGETTQILLADVKGYSSADYAIRVIGKGEKQRTIYAPKELVNDIKKYFGGKTYLFEHSPRSYRGKQGMITYSATSISSRIRGEAERILGVRYTAHSMRHGFITELIDNGAPLPRVSKYVGHASIRTTGDIYVSGGLKPDMIKKFSKIYKSA